MKKLLFIIFVFGFSLVQAQTMLTIDEAIQIALEKNYDISIARNEGLIARTNNTTGNAGMLPNIGFNANGSLASKSVRSRPNDTSPFTYTSPDYSSLGANVSLDWTLFDGGKMFIAKNRLSEIQALGEINYRNQVLKTLSEVVSAYYNVVKQKQQLTSIEQTIKYNQERLKIAQTGYNAGAKKKTDLLQAKIDLNVNLENAINQQTLILVAKRELAVLLALESDSLFEVIDSIALDYVPDRNKLQQMLFSKNTDILAFEKKLEIEQLVLKESNRSQLPRIDFNAGYFYSKAVNSENAGTNVTTHSMWPQVGWSMNIPIFQSGDLRRQVALSKIGVELARYNFENVKLGVNAELKNALTTFENQQKLLVIEHENYELAKENMEISLQRMRLGEATSLEVRIAQEDFEQSATRLTNFQYNLKMAETKLKQLMGDL